MSILKFLLQKSVKVRDSKFGLALVIESTPQVGSPAKLINSMKSMHVYHVLRFPSVSAKTVVVGLNFFMWCCLPCAVLSSLYNFVVFCVQCRCLPFLIVQNLPVRHCKHKLNLYARSTITVVFDCSITKKKAYLAATTCKIQTNSECRCCTTMTLYYKEHAWSWPL